MEPVAIRPLAWLHFDSIRVRHDGEYTFFNSGESIVNLIQRQLRLFRILCLSGAALAGCCLTGCSNSSPDAASGGPPSIVPGDPPDIETSAHAHDHPAEGPHHGDLVELGGEEFHAEVVHGEGEKVSVYILDGAAKVSVPIDAPDLSINIAHDDTAKQFKLPADPDPADTDGKSSRFSLTDAELSKVLDSHDSVARLVVTINGKSYSGKITHRHDGDHKH